MQAGAGCSHHPAPCLRRYASIHNGFTPHIATTIIPFFPGENKGKGKGGDGFLCVVLFGGAGVWFLFRILHHFFVALRKERGGDKAQKTPSPPSRKQGTARRFSRYLTERERKAFYEDDVQRQTSRRRSGRSAGSRPRSRRSWGRTRNSPRVKAKRRPGSGKLSAPRKPRDFSKSTDIPHSGGTRAPTTDNGSNTKTNGEHMRIVLMRV